MNKDRISLHFGKAFATYDRAAMLQYEMAETLLEKTLQKKKAETIESILEIGCGTGNLTSLLLQRCPQCSIVAIDIAKPMIQEAKRKLNFPTNVVFLAEDAEKFMNTARHRFDLIISNATMQWLVYPRETITRYSHWLSPHGMLSFSTFGEPTFCELRYVFSAMEKQFGLPKTPHTLPFLSRSLWKSFLRVDQSEKAIILTEEKKHYYRNVREYFSWIKQLGASSPYRNRSYTLTKTKLKCLEEIYKRVYAHPTTGRIPVSFQLLYGIAQKEAFL